MFLIKYSVVYRACFLAVVQVSAEVVAGFVVSKKKSLCDLSAVSPHVVSTGLCSL